MRDRKKSTKTRKATRHRRANKTKLENNRLENASKGTNDSPRKKNPRNKKPQIFNERFVSFLLGLAVVTIIITSLRHSYFKVSQVYVEGNEKIQGTEVISKIDSPIGKNILFYNTGKQEKKLLETEMIDEASISKKFPKIINIKISENYPEFYIDNGNKVSYLSNKLRRIDNKNLPKNLESSLTKIKIKGDGDEAIDKFAKDEDNIDFINKIKKTSYKDSISELNLENKAHIGIIVKDIRVDFGNMNEITYKLGLLESILKDVESKDQDVSSINLSNGKKPVVEINEGS